MAFAAVWRNACRAAPRRARHGRATSPRPTWAGTGYAMNDRPDQTAAESTPPQQRPRRLVQPAPLPPMPAKGAPLVHAAPVSTEEQGTARAPATPRSRRRDPLERVHGKGTKSEFIRLTSTAPVGGFRRRPGGVLEATTGEPPPRGTAGRMLQRWKRVLLGAPLAT